MATTAGSSEAVYQDALVNYLISMAPTVESNVNRALDVLLSPKDSNATELTGKIFLAEPRINEMEIVIDEHAVRLLRSSRLQDMAIRQVVATLKITNDLERMGDLAVNIGERVISLAQMPAVEPPPELASMAPVVRVMVKRAWGR